MIASVVAGPAVAVGYGTGAATGASDVGEAVPGGGTADVVGVAAVNDTVSRISFDYADYGGSVNLEVNGDRASVEEFDAAPPDGLDGATLGGANVTVLSRSGGGGGGGRVVIVGSISSFSVGGQETVIDNVAFGPSSLPLATVTFDAVTPAQASYAVGDAFVADGVNVSVEAYEFTDGRLYRNGSGGVRNTTTFTAGAGRPDFYPGNVNLRFDVAGVAAATGDGCLDVTTSGYHTVGGDVTNSSERYCIEVTADDVIVDGRGHEIDGVGPSLGAAAEPPVGVYVHDARNVTVRNLTVAEWQTGAVYRNASGRLDGVDVRRASLDGIVADDATVEVANGTVTADDDGIQAEAGADVQVRDTRIDDGNGTTTLQRGVRTTGGSVATLRNVTVADAAITGLLVNTGSTGDVVRSDFRDNEVGVSLRATSQADVVNTTVADSRLDGIRVVSGSDLVLQGGRVVGSGRNGVAIDAARADVRGVRVARFGEAGVNLTARTDARATEIHASDLVDDDPADEDYGVDNRNTSAIVNATGNYWGAANGPSSEGQFLEAEGFEPFDDPVTGRLADGNGTAVTFRVPPNSTEYGDSNVHFDPFATAPVVGPADDGNGTPDTPVDFGVELEQRETVRQGGDANVSAFVRNRATRPVGNVSVRLLVDADGDGRFDSDEVVADRIEAFAPGEVRKVPLVYGNVSLPAGNYSYQARAGIDGRFNRSFTNGTLTVTGGPDTPVDFGVELEQRETVRRGGDANVSAFVRNRATRPVGNVSVRLLVDADGDGRFDSDEVVADRIEAFAPGEVRNVPLVYGNVSLPAGNYSYQARAGVDGRFDRSFTNGTLTVTGGAVSDATVSRVAFDYGSYGGNLNLEVNGDFRNVGQFDAAPPTGVNDSTVGGANVTVRVRNRSLSGVQGTVVVDGSVSSFAVGGQELWVDNVELGSAANVTFDSVAPAQPEYGVNETFTADGVDVQVAAFTYSNGNTTTDGFGRVDNTSTATAAGGGPDFNTNNVLLRFDVNGAATANPYPGGVPGVSSTPPTDALDGRGYEDVNGDGAATLGDVIDFLFALSDVASADLTASQRAALDFDGSGTVDFLDVVELLFRV